MKLENWKWALGERELQEKVLILVWATETGTPDTERNLFLCIFLPPYSVTHRAQSVLQWRWQQWMQLDPGRIFLFDCYQEGRVSFYDFFFCPLTTYPKYRATAEWHHRARQLKPQIRKIVYELPDLYLRIVCINLTVIRIADWEVNWQIGHHPVSATLIVYMQDRSKQHLWSWITDLTLEP